MAKPDYVTEFVHQYGQQIHPAKRIALGKSVQFSVPAFGELHIVAGRFIREPTEAARVEIDNDCVIHRETQFPIGQVADLHDHFAQGVGEPEGLRSYGTRTVTHRFPPSAVALGA